MLDDVFIFHMPAVATGLRGIRKLRIDDLGADASDDFLLAEVFAVRDI